jgi:P-type Mg2+ transporter
MDQLAWKFWSFTVERVFEGLGASPGGLTFEEARRRLTIYGRNHLKLRKRSHALRLLLAQFKSPLIIILLLAAALSFFLSETVDAMIIMGIVLLSGLLGLPHHAGVAII